MPLLIGHGGNTGSQANATAIKALALGQVKPADHALVVRREALAGGAMGAVLGATVYAASFVWVSLPRAVALTVAVSLPIVSMWSNALGGGVPLAMAAAGFNPAVSSAPLVTTVIDASGLAIYLSLAKVIMGI